MILHPEIPVYGNTKFRGACPTEDAEHVTFLNVIRREYPTTWGALIIHPKNEGKRTVGQASWDKARGSVTKGASDFILPAAFSFVCEMKRRDHTKSRWQDGQQDYLLAARDAGAFICVALGWEAAMEAFDAWLCIVRQ